MAEEDHNEVMKSGSAREPRSVFPWVIAGVVIALIVIAVLLIGRGSAPSNLASSNPGGAGLAPPAAYAKNLAITNIRMSESSTLSGAKQTYIDGDIANNGPETLAGITVQVAFRDFTGQIGQKSTMPMALIRTHEPYIDVEPVSVAPIAPGQTREFRLIFDHVTDSWNQQYPEIRVIAIESK
ncbi:MAG: DUF2393 family protein [Acidobacteriaceae bacterium]